MIKHHQFNNSNSNLNLIPPHSDLWKKRYIKKLQNQTQRKFCKYKKPTQINILKNMSIKIPLK